jgi:hypothetical protein
VDKHSESEVLFDSPDGVWVVSIRPPIDSDGSFYATFSGKGVSNGVPFGYSTALSDLEVRWDLPDSVLGAFLKNQCYLLFRWGPTRRRRREHARVGLDMAFTSEEIQWVCSPNHSEAQLREKFRHV